MQILQQIRKATQSLSASAQLEIRPWYPVRLLALYRLFIAILLGGLFSLGDLGGSNPSLFISAALVYLFLTILWLILIYLRRPDYRAQVYAHITSDILLYHQRHSIDRRDDSRQRRSRQRPGHPVDRQYRRRGTPARRPRGIILRRDGLPIAAGGTALYPSHHRHAE
jgi:hypothetical protein